MYKNKLANNAEHVSTLFHLAPGGAWLMMTNQ